MANTDNINPQASEKVGPCSVSVHCPSLMRISLSLISVRFHLTEKRVNTEYCPCCYKRVQRLLHIRFIQGAAVGILTL